MDTIIQWNCRSFKANYDELSLLIHDHNPIAICLQETFLKENDTITIKHFSIYNHYNIGAGRASGGVSIIVNNDAPHAPISLNTNLQAVAVKISLHKPVTLCSIYLPPGHVLDIRDLDGLMDQIDGPFILLGDFNGHNVLWGCDDNNDRGKKLEDFIDNHRLCLFNDKSKTYLHPATGSYSSLDLTLCDPSLLLDFTWRVGDDLCGSDHFPIFLHSNGPPTRERTQRWKLHKADWLEFQSMCNDQLQQDNFVDVDDPVRIFTSILHSIAEATIPKTSSKPKRFNKPWHDAKTKAAIKDRKRALRLFNSRPTADNLNNYRITRAKARRTIRGNKRDSWRKYVSKLNSRSSIKHTWDMVRRINGKGKASFKHLKKGNNIVTSKEDIANTLGESFSRVSSSEHSAEEFLKIKTRKEKTKLKFKSDNTECYNQPFSISELRDSLERAHDTAAGPDDIHYQLLKHLPFEALSTLLFIFNTIWEGGSFPPSWREATVIPVPKPGKDHTDPSNYRPIALTSCVCKTMERMINWRLVWFLESN